MRHPDRCILASPGIQHRPHLVPSTYRISIIVLFFTRIVELTHIRFCAEKSVRRHIVWQHGSDASTPVFGSSLTQVGNASWSVPAIQSYPTPKQIYLHVT